MPIPNSGGIAFHNIVVAFIPRSGLRRPEMSLSARIVYSVLASIILVAFIFRYPLESSELGVDSFVIHGLAQVALDDARLSWVLNPLSLFGLYPLSHPAGPIFLLVDISSVGGLPVGGSILVLDFLTAFLGAIGAFFLVREIKTDARVGLMAALLLVLAPRFVATTVWQVPTRSLLTALIPWFIWSMLVLRRTPTLRRASILVIVLTLLMASHRLFVLVAVIVAAYIAAALLLAILRIIRIAYSGAMLRPGARRAMRMGSWCLVLLFVVYFITFSDVLSSYEEGRLGLGSDVLTRVQNFGVSLTRSSGILLPLAGFGIAGLIHGRNNDIRQAWLIAMFLGLLPTLGLRQYVGAYIPPFVAVFGAIGIFWIVAHMPNRKRLQKTIVTVSVTALVVSSAFVVQFDISLLDSLHPSIYNGGLFMRNHDSGSFVSNSGSLGAKLNAVSGSPYLPIGGATTSQQGPELLAFGFIDPAEMRIHMIPVSALTIEDDSVFILENVNVELTWALLLGGPLDEATEQISQYSLRFYVEALEFSGQFEAFNNVYASPFARDVARTRYVVFSSDGYRIYSI